MIVQLAQAAEDDLEAIADYIARDSPARALTFIRELRAKCFDLAEGPERFPLVTRYSDRRVRRRLHGRYLILYRVEVEAVIVLRVMHGAMDYASVLSDDR